MTTLRYISAQPPRFRNAADACVIPRYLARFICQISKNMDFKIGKKLHI